MHDATYEVSVGEMDLIVGDHEAHRFLYLDSVDSNVSALVFEIGVKADLIAVFYLLGRRILIQDALFTQCE